MKLMFLRYWLVLVVLISLAVRVPEMFGFQRTGWDERAYAVFAKTISQGGVSGIRQWMHDYPTNESLQKSPLLLRVGFVIPAMLVCKMLGGFTPDNVAWLSFAAGVALILLGAHFTEVLTGRRIAMLCAVLLITSPLAAGLSRRGTQDTFTALVFLACLYFFHRCWVERTVFAHSAFGLCLTLALLTKESAVLLYPLIALAAIYYYYAMKLRPRYWLGLALILAPLVYLLIETWICGGLGNLVDTYRIYSTLQNKLEYTTRYEKGPWFAYALDLLAIAPLAFVSGIIGLSMPTKESTGHGRNLALIYLAGICLLFAQLPIINVRLILFADVFLRLAAILGASYFAAKFSTKWVRPFLFAIIGLIMVNDAFAFYQVFAKGNVYSPTTFLLLRAEGFFQTP
jgi:4-amino-4-deoxy-L-arabinose transferase-like glycosyltransferase